MMIPAVTGIEAPSVPIRDEFATRERCGRPWLPIAVSQSHELRYRESRYPIDEVDPGDWIGIKPMITPRAPSGTYCGGRLSGAPRAAAHDWQGRDARKNFFEM
jgi:hypothetical protein